MTDAVQHFAINAAGRDFAVGDIHGCFDQLRAALSHVLFDPEHDRMFATGDLVDRGPRSAAALEWLAQPWFHSCLGNHESMRLDEPDPGRLALWLLLNGGEWWFATSETARQQFLAAFARLPYVLEVQTAHGRVGIVHADVPGLFTWPQFLQALMAGDPEAREAALWSRQRAEGRLTEPVADIERVVCGHTIMADGKPRVVGNVWLIDTGAFLLPPYGDLTVLPLDELFADSARGTSAASPPLMRAE